MAMRKSRAFEFAKLIRSLSVDASGRLKSTGTPTDSADVTTKSYVDTKIDAMLTVGAPALLNSLDELAAAMGDDPNFLGTLVAKTSAQAISAGENALTITGSTVTLTRGDGTTDTITVSTSDTVYDSTAIDAAVALNTAKTGITSGQASAITANTAKVTNVDHPLVQTAVPAGALFTDTNTVYDSTAIDAAVALNTAKVTNVDHPLVQKAVPSDAVFTDTNTVYTHPANHPISTITGLQTALDGKYSEAETDAKIVELSPPATKAHVESLGILANTITGALPAIDGSALTGVTPTKVTVDALGINATHVSGFTVGKSVPSNAVFTDTNTTYTVGDGGLTTHNFTTADHNKLNNIDTDANNYNHPANHAISVTTGLQAALDGKVDDSQVLTNVPAGAVFTDTVYTHPANHSIATISGLSTALAGKVDDGQVLTNVPSGAVFTDTNTVYTHPANHPISTITGLQTALNNKVDDTQVLTNVPSGAVFTDTNTVYTHPANHSIATISGLQTALNNKVDDTQVLTNVPLSAVFTDTETTTTLSHNVATKTLSYVNELGATTNISLTQYLDDTNLARLISGSLAASGMATFTRSDNTTFTIDMSDLLDTDTNTWRSVTDSTSTTSSTVGASATAVKAAYDRTWPDTNTHRGIDDTPVNGQTGESISSNWAFDHNASSTAHPRDTRNQIAGTYNNYSHPTGAGNNHVPSGGSSGQFLKYSSSGVATWATPSYTTNTDTNTHRGIDNTPVNGQTAESISSNWAFDHAASSTGHPRDTRSQVAGSYSVSTHTHSAYAPKASPTFTGTINNAGTLTTGGGYHQLNTQYGNIKLGPMNSSFAHIYTDSPSFYFNKELKILNNLVWNAGNDGAGSGLDADLLDGQQGSYYSPTSHTHSYLPLAGGNLTGNLHIAENHTASVTNAATALAGTSFSINGNTSEGSDALRMGALASGNGGYFIETSNYSHTAAYPILLNPINGGHVGIGTLAPTSSLDVVGTGTFTADTNALYLKSVTTGVGVEIAFTDTIPSLSQHGYLRYFHQDAKSYGSGNSFVLTGSEASMSIVADGKLLYKEGLYVKPASGTGAGTLVISSSRAVSATTVGVTNIVTNKVVKFDGSVLNDSNITDTGSAITLGSNTSVNGSLMTGGLTSALSDTSNLKLDVQGHVGIRGASGLYFGITTNNYNSWKTRIGSNNTSTMTISAQGLTVNNSGYGSSVFLTANSSGLTTLGHTVWHAGNDGSGSSLDADTLDGLHLNQIVPYHSGSNFPLGTLVTTNIPSSATNGASFILELTGKSYSSAPPFSIIAQGYLYSDTIVSSSGANLSGNNSMTYIKVMNNAGYLSFWWPTYGYWHSFSVNVRDAGGSSVNRVTAITNIAEPAGATKKVQINLSKNWSSVNDGSGSGLDADLLDGQQGSYYYPASNPNGYTNDQTAAEILTKIKTVDGSGSGLDADLLDGKQADRFVSGSNTNKTNNTGSANGDLPSGFYDQNVGDMPTGTYYSYINMRHTNEGNHHGAQIAVSFYSQDLYTRHYQGGNASGNGSFSAWDKHWRAGNDGSGSGLDADLLDGQQGSYYAPSSHTHSYLPLAGGTLTGQVNIDYPLPKFIVGSTSNLDTSDANRPNITLNGGMYPHMTIDSRVDGSGNASTNTNHGPVFSFVSRLGTSGYRRWAMGTAAYNAGALSWGYYDNNANPHYGMGGNAGYTSTGSKMWLATTGSLSTTSQGVLWGASNDGSGSGLDADLLDGNQASAFLLASQGVRYFEATSAPGTTTNGTMWLDTSDDTLYQRQDGSWVQISTSNTPAVLIFNSAGTLLN